MQPDNTSFPLLLQLDFPQILQIVLQLPEPYKNVLKDILDNPNIQNSLTNKYIDKHRGTLNIEEYQKKESKTQNWEQIQGKWPGKESDEEIINALENLS